MPTPTPQDAQSPYPDALGLAKLIPVALRSCLTHCGYMFTKTAVRRWRAHGFVDLLSEPSVNPSPSRPRVQRQRLLWGAVQDGQVTSPIFRAAFAISSTRACVPSSSIGTAIIMASSADTSKPVAVIQIVWALFAENNFVIDFIASLWRARVFGWCGWSAPQGGQFSFFMFEMTSLSHHCRMIIAIKIRLADRPDWLQ